MRTLKLCMALGLVLALVSPGWALSSNAGKLTNVGDPLRFSVNFSGFEIDYGDVVDPQTGGVIGSGTGLALGYVPSNDPGGIGAGRGGLYVLYDSSGTVIADVDAAGANTPGVANLGLVLANNQFTAFGVGTIDSIQNPDGNTVANPQTRPGGPGDTYQMTFTAADIPVTFVPSVNPVSQTFDTGFDSVTGLGTGTVESDFLPGGVVEILEDRTTDAQGSPLGLPTPGDGSTVAGELPVSYMSGIDYYEPAVSGGAGAFAFNSPAAGPEADAMEAVVLALSHNGALSGTDSFGADWRGPVIPASLPAGYVTAGTPVNHPTLGPIGIWSGGRTTFRDNDVSLDITGGTWVPMPIADTPGFRMTSDVAFGYYQTGNTATFGGPLGNDPGALPEDAASFTFQTPDGAGPEIFGGNIVPEPLTMLGVFLGIGGLGNYIRRRRMG